MNEIFGQVEEELRIGGMVKDMDLGLLMNKGRVSACLWVYVWALRLNLLLV